MPRNDACKHLRGTQSHPPSNDGIVSLLPEEWPGMPKPSEQDVRSPLSGEPLPVPDSQLACQRDDVPASTRCIHCRKPAFVYARGICRRCWRDPKARAKYKRLWGKSCRNYGKPWEYERAERPKPWVPTRAKPGDKKKLDVFAVRRGKGTELHHSDDFDSQPRDLTEFMLAIVYAGVKGVYQDRRGRWRAYPYDPGRANGKGRHKHLGYFLTRAEACLEVLEWHKAGCPREWKAKKIVRDSEERTNRRLVTSMAGRYKPGVWDNPEH